MSWCRGDLTNAAWWRPDCTYTDVDVRCARCYDVISCCCILSGRYWWGIEISVLGATKIPGRRCCRVNSQLRHCTSLFMESGRAMLPKSCHALILHQEHRNLRAKKGTAQQQTCPKCHNLQPSIKFPTAWRQNGRIQTNSCNFSKLLVAQQNLHHPPHQT